jgi:hypothetical protein
VVSNKSRGSFVWLVLIFTAVIVLVAISSLQAAFNKYEVKVITENIETSFKQLIDTWNEELYFEMYDFGQRASQQRITRGEFAQRMVELKWKPTLEPVEIDKIDILYLNFAVIYFWQEFENKVNVLKKVKKYLVLPINLENNTWKYDLTQLIRIPYEGKFEKPVTEPIPNATPATPPEPAPAPGPGPGGGNQ